MTTYKDSMNEGVKQIFAKNLQKKLREYDMTQNELARRMSLNPSTISDWCRGTVLPRSNRLEQLCEVLHCEPADLLGDVQAAVDNELSRWYTEEVQTKQITDQLHRQLIESYQAISRAMSELDPAGLDRLAAYAEGLLAASGKDKIS